MTDAARALIDQLKLEPLPHEGGFFRPIWRSAAKCADGRAASSAILFLMTDRDFSALHRLRSEELWLFHSGDPVEHIQMDPTSGECRTSILAADSRDGTHVSIPNGVWQGARLHQSTESTHTTSERVGWALVSCVVTPGWGDRDFELGTRDALQAQFPEHAELIAALTR